MTTPPQFRLESDSLGEIQVPVSALYGAQTQRAVENFPVSGLRPWPAFIWSMAAIKYAAATVNGELGLLNPKVSSAIMQAAAEVMEGMWADQFVVDPFQAGAGTSHNMNLNEVLANRATQLLGGKPGEYRVHPNDHVNMSQSTNDTIPTAIRLGVLWRLKELLSSIQSLAEALTEKAREFDPILKSGRTHLQDAVPLRLGQEFSAYALAVQRDGERIQQAARELGRLGIGGTAVGSGLNAHPQYAERMVQKLSGILGTPLVMSENLFESMQSLADVAAFSSALRTLALTLTRIANDFRLLSSGPSTGLDELRLPAVQPGSSIMPGKVNPVLAEMLNQAMFHIIGCDTTISLAVAAGQLELNVMMPVIAHNLFEAMQICIGSISAFTENCVRGLEANPQKAVFWLERNPIIITALNPLIGYTVGAALVKEARERDISIKELALEKARQGALLHLDTNLPLTPGEIETALGNLYRLTEGGLVGFNPVG